MCVWRDEMCGLISSRDLGAKRMVYHYFCVLLSIFLLSSSLFIAPVSVSGFQEHACVGVILLFFYRAQTISIVVQSCQRR